MTTESFELVSAGETCWSRGLDPDDLILILEERDAAGEKVGGTRIATFPNMRFMDSLAPRLAKLCQGTAQAELDKAGGVPPRAPATGPQPHARLGDDVVVCDFDWRNPKLAWPGTWLFHDIKRNRPLFQARKRDIGDDPPVEVLVALLLAFAAGERAGREDGRDEGRAALAGDMRKLMGVGA
ncbi:hypothetical protein [Methylobacterium platani]|uniref:Uncharacterized protein n=2 Tax=Methylobacterium platani TaxID=427683 RepID=A0A179S608_9HYPH|nr:hypothetical protein [Methylobacterium platani]KMO22400.1 hypothetical protein SQ03_00520 [Methylobacterium platani JCM 14648]OAS22483.1 hypothetical protein A5481_18990 [Methylobacterium platani]